MASRRDLHHNRRRGAKPHMRDNAIVKQNYSRSAGNRESGTAQKAVQSQKAR